MYIYIFVLYKEGEEEEKGMFFLLPARAWNAFSPWNNQCLL